MRPGIHEKEIKDTEEVGEWIRMWIHWTIGLVE